MTIPLEGGSTFCADGGGWVHGLAVCEDAEFAVGGWSVAWGAGCADVCCWVELGAELGCGYLDFYA